MFTQATAKRHNMVAKVSREQIVVFRMQLPLLQLLLFMVVLVMIQLGRGGEIIRLRIPLGSGSTEGERGGEDCDKGIEEEPHGYRFKEWLEGCIEETVANSLQNDSTWLGR